MALLFAMVTATETNYIRYLLAASAATLVSWLVTLRASRHPLWDELARAWAGLHAMVGGMARRVH